MLARSAHFAFYILLVVVPATGLLAYYGWDALGDVHSWAKPVFIVLILVHAGAALVHQFLLRDGTLERMFRVTR
jgi:cytochrome b561